MQTSLSDCRPAFTLAATKTVDYLHFTTQSTRVSDRHESGSTKRQTTALMSAASSGLTSVYGSAITVSGLALCLRDHLGPR